MGSRLWYNYNPEKGKWVKQHRDAGGMKRREDQERKMLSHKGRGKKGEGTEGRAETKVADQSKGSEVPNFL